MHNKVNTAYTPIITKIDQTQFNKYIEIYMTKEITTKTLKAMETIEQMIIASNAYKSAKNKQLVSIDKWESYNIKKTTLSELFFHLNKITFDNLTETVTQTKQFNKLTLTEINQLADVFLGKCIIEQNNIDILLIYFKLMLKNGCWTVYDTNSDIKTISFRDIMMDRLQNEYVRLIKISTQIEEEYKNQNAINSDQYMKKKGIIISLIELIGSFFNEHIISVTLLCNIFEELQTNYEKDVREINFIELILVLWNKTALYLYCAHNEIYNNYKNWLITIKSSCNRLNMLITKSIDIIDGIKKDNKQITTILLKIANEHDLNNKTNNILFITEYLTDNMEDKIINILLTNEQLNYDIVINILINYFVSEQSLKQYITNVLNNDDMICDYPKFNMYMKRYVENN